MSPVAAVVSLAIMMLGGCSPAAVSSPSRPSALQQGIPTETPSIQGVITSIGNDRRIRVEENSSNDGSAKAIVRITSQTQLRDGRGNAVAESSLAIGMLVRVWFTGPVAESFPLQATARVLVVDATR